MVIKVLIITIDADIKIRCPRIHNGTSGGGGNGGNVDQCRVAEYHKCNEM
jgi:hypothetical protein